MTKNSIGSAGLNIGQTQANIMLALTVFLWSVGVVIARAVHDEIPLIGLSFWRWIMASLLLLPFVWKELRDKHDIVRENMRLLVMLGILIVGSGALLFYSLNFTTAINATLVNATQPVLTVFLSWILLGDRLKGIQMLGVMSAMFGVGIMVSRADLNVIVNFDFNKGDFLVILAIIGYAIYAINLHKLPKKLGTFPALFVILFSGSLFLSPFYMAESIYVKPVPFSLLTIGLTIILAIFVSILSMSMWNMANRVIGPGRAVMFVNLLPVYGAILAIIFLDEKLYLYHLFGAGLVCMGIFMVVRKY